MKVNGVDIRKFKAVQLTVELLPPKFSVNTEWVEGAKIPHEFETNVQYGTLKLTVLFRGSGRNEINRTMSEFLALLTRRSELQLDGYKGTYIGDITKNEPKKTKARDKYVLSLEFNGYMTDREVVHTYQGENAATFTTQGTRAAPCVVEILPESDLPTFTIRGFGSDDIVLKNLKRGKLVTIDGIKGTVMQEGANKFGDCDMWEFPYLEQGTENALMFSSSNCSVTIRYRPMWL